MQPSNRKDPEGGTGDGLIVAKDARHGKTAEKKNHGHVAWRRGSHHATRCDTQHYQNEEIHRRRTKDDFHDASGQNELSHARRQMKESRTSDHCIVEKIAQLTSSAQRASL
jgi:hypothetical protein